MKSSSPFHLLIATAYKAVMMFKDEYFLDFINTEEIIVKVEQELIKNSKRIGRKELQRLEPELEGKTDAT